MQATHPDSHGLLEHLHCWLMVILHHHTGRSARGLGSQLPAKHESNISVKQVQNIMSSSETCVWKLLSYFLSHKLDGHNQMAESHNNILNLKYVQNTSHVGWGVSGFAGLM